MAAGHKQSAGGGSRNQASDDDRTAIEGDRESATTIEHARSTRIDVDRDNSDDSQTNAIPTVDVAELVGPANVPAPLHDAPKDAHGHIDWVKLQALVTAVEALVSAGMSTEARPLVSQVRDIVERARAPVARVIELDAERAKRSD